MKKLFKLMMFNALLRAEEGAEGANGGGSDKTADLAAQVAALAAQLEELKKAHPAPANPPSDADKLRAELEAKKQKEAAVARLQEAIKFNLGVAAFVSDNKDYLGKLAEGLVRTVNEKQFSDEERKAAATSGQFCPSGRRTRHKHTRKIVNEKRSNRETNVVLWQFT